MMKTTLCASASVLLFAGETTSFAPTTHGIPFHTQSQSMPSLVSVSPLHATSMEEDAMFMMEKARDCAFSDTCSIDDANMYLEEIVSVQGNCAAGVLTDDAVCGNADLVSEIIVQLRSKVEDVQTLE